MARSRVHGIVVACARLAALALAAALLAPSPAGAFETHYRVVDLGGVMAGSGAFALSRDGSAVGFEMFGPSLPHAVAERQPPGSPGGPLQGMRSRFIKNGSSTESMGGE